MKVFVTGRNGIFEPCDCTLGAVSMGVKKVKKLVRDAFSGGER